MTATRQAVVYYPHTLEIGKPAQWVDVAEKPTRVWTLYLHRDPAAVPILPYEPLHNVNAFLEDQIHDWIWRDGRLKYYSRVIDGRVWLLLEYGP